MVLMEISAIVRQDKIWDVFSFEFSKKSFISIPT